MNDFDQRWQTLTRHARQAFSEEVSEGPSLGFAIRVMEFAKETSGEGWEEVFNQLGLRAVLATAIVFLMSAGFAFSEWYDPRLELPALGKTVTSELSWP